MNSSFEEAKAIIERRWKDQPNYLEALYIYFRNYAHYQPQYRCIEDQNLIKFEIERRNPEESEIMFNNIAKFRQALPNIGKIATKVANYIEDAYDDTIEKLVDRRVENLSPENLDIIDFFSRYLVDRFTISNTLGSYERYDRKPNQSFIEILDLNFKGKGEKAYELLHTVGLLVGVNYISEGIKVYHHYYDILPIWSRSWIGRKYKRSFEVPTLKPAENRCQICGEKIRVDELSITMFGHNVHSFCFDDEYRKFEDISTNNPVETEILRNFLATHVLNVIEIRTEQRVGQSYKLGHPIIGQKSIDAVCRTPDDIWILEIKQELTGDSGFKAIGQVISYSFLYKKEHPGLKKPLKMGIVCDGAERELIEVCQNNGIEVFFCSSY